MRQIIALAYGTFLAVVAGLAVAGGNQSAAAREEPRLLNPRQVQPWVPETAIRRRISGDVLVQFRLDDKGRTQGARVVLAEPKGVFEENTLRAVAKMRFSLPSEWIVDNPKRLVEMAFVFLVNRCGSGDAFPGIPTMIIRTAPAHSLSRLEQECAELRQSKKEAT